MAVFPLLPVDGVAHLEDDLLMMIFEIMFNIPAHLEALSKVFLKKKSNSFSITLEDY